MYKLIIVVITGFFVLNTGSVYSQDENPKDSVSVSPQDTTDNGWDDFEAEDKELNFGFMKGQFDIFGSKDVLYKAPYMDVNIGFSEPYYDKPHYNEKFGQIGIAEIKLGYEKHYSLSNSPYVFKFSKDVFSLANASADYFNPDISDGEIKTELWNLGIGEDKGYGYIIDDDFKVILYSGNGMNWNHLKFEANGYAVPESGFGDTPEVFGKQVRFGGYYNSGIRMQFFERVNLGAEYSQNFVFPRHMFWYWTAGEITEAIITKILDEFVEEIEKSSPYLVPVANLVFKTGLRYGLYELRKDNMNWPINSAPPFMYESFKATVSVNF